MRRIDTATKAVDLFGAGKHGFKDGDPALAILATKLNAAFFNSAQEELASVVEAVGLGLNPADNTQLLQAIRLLPGRVLGKSIAGGANVTLTADESQYPMILLTGVITANISVIVPNAGREWVVANGTTGAFTVTVKTAAGSGVAVAQGASLHLYCDLASVLQVGASTAQKQIQAITASVAAGALTLGVPAGTRDFRSATLGSGAVNSRTFSALSLVVPSGASLGAVNAVAARLVLLEIDNAGTIELAVVNLAGGLNLDETTLINTTAISAASTAANVIYSAAAHTGVPFRVVGFIDSTQVTAGTYATAPAIVQGVGGQALAALSSIGYGQRWQNVLGSRAGSTSYTNTTGRPIVVSASNGGVNSAAISLTIDGVVIASASVGAAAPAGFQVTGIVPPGSVYSVTVNTSLTLWAELR